MSQQWYQTVALYELSDEYLDELNKQINWILENENERNQQNALPGDCIGSRL